jgi:cobalt-zinc-cadmium resistance protein CzcA
LVLRIYGQDLGDMRRIGNQMVDVIRGVRGTEDASIFQEPPIPQLTITADRDAAARYGVNVGDITSLIQTAIGGSPITQVYVEDRIYNVTARVSNEVANSVQAVGEMPLTSTTGAQVPLKEVAHIKLAMGESTIAHEHGQRELTISIENSGRALSEYLADAQAQIETKVHYDKSKYTLEWAGNFQNEQRAQARLIVVMGMVMAIMAVLLFAEFGKFHQAMLVLGVVPLATVGGLIALHIRGETLNIATAVGFIALFGVAVQNGIIMVSNINRVRREGLSLFEAVVVGATERFRPVLMTATVASIGMLPAALATGVGTDVQRGLATVVVGGLPIATLLTLFILPALYYGLENFIYKRFGHAPSAVEI